MKTRVEIKDGFRATQPVLITANLTLLGSHAADVAALLGGTSPASAATGSSTATHSKPTFIRVPPQTTPLPPQGIGGMPFSISETGKVEMSLSFDIKQSVERGVSYRHRRSHSFSSFTDWDRRSLINTQATFFAVEQSQAGTSTTQNLSLLVIAADNWEESNGLSTTARQYEAQFDASVYVLEPTGAYALPFLNKPNYAVDVPDSSTGAVIAAAVVAKIQTIVREEALRAAKSCADAFRRSQLPAFERAQDDARATAEDDAYGSRSITYSH